MPAPVQTIADNQAQLILREALAQVELELGRWRPTLRGESMYMAAKQALGRHLIGNALLVTGNRSRAAAVLGISRHHVATVARGER